MQEYIDTNVSTLHRALNEYKVQVQTEFSMTGKAAEDMEMRMFEKFVDVNSTVSVIRDELDHNVSKLSKHIFETQMISHDHQ